MGLSGVLEAIIGLVFIYFLVSVLCSGLNEAIAQETGRRGRFLREGLINIVRDRWLFLRLTNHPLVSSMYRDVPGKPRTPSYIPPGSLVNALLDIIVLKARQIDPARAATTGQMLTFDEVRAAALTCKQGGFRWPTHPAPPRCGPGQSRRGEEESRGVVHGGDGSGVGLVQAPHPPRTLVRGAARGRGLQRGHLDHRHPALALRRATQVSG
jgi:hypothetical protein